MNGNQFLNLPSELRIDVIAELINQKKYLDLDILLYNFAIPLETLSSIYNQVKHVDEYLLHHLLMKCNAQIRDYDGLNPHIREFIKSNPAYCVELQPMSDLKYE